jgi:hypothetical protein
MAWLPARGGARTGETWSAGRFANPAGARAVTGGLATAGSFTAIDSRAQL